MAAETRDMHFIEFKDWPLASEGAKVARERHLAWFMAKGLRHEMVAPQGLLEGDSGIFAVHFDGADDPRLAEYTSEFETPDGRSLDPESYQMVFLPYDAWLAAPGRAPDHPRFWDGCSAVEVIPGKVSGAPLLKETRMPARGVLENAEDGLSPEEIAKTFGLDLDMVRAVLDHTARRGVPPGGSPDEGSET
jgi:uncharacterized protein (DUF433 family)